MTYELKLTRFETRRGRGKAACLARSGILSIDKPDSRNRSTSPRSKMRFGRPMLLPLFVPCRRGIFHYSIPATTRSRITFRSNSAMAQ
jgi:hypothetical protein